MEATLHNDVISVSSQTVQSTKTSKVRRANGSKEFLSGVFYIIKKLFLLG